MFGFFSAVKTLVKGAVSFAKAAVPVVTAIKSIFSSGSSEVGRTSSYDNETSSVSETENINNILSNYSKKVVHEAKKNEKAIIRHINEIYDDLSYNLQIIDVFDERKARRFKNDREKIENMCRGGIEKHINKRFSIDDSDCLEILKMQNGHNKEKRMREFSDKVMLEGVNILYENIEIYVDNDQDLIYESIREKINDNNAKLLNKKKSYEEIFNLKSSDSNKLKEFINERKNKIELANKVIESINVGE